MSGSPFRIFHSKVVSFDRCRKQYWYRYLSGFDQPHPPATPEGIIGSGVHRAMKTLCDTGEPEDGARELDVYLRMPSHAIAGPGTEAHTTAFQLFARGCEVHASIASDDRWAELDTWLRPGGGDVTISARIDRADRLVDGAWQIIDWKTGRIDMPDPTDAQLDIGHLAVRTMRQLPREAPVTAIAWNLRTGQRRVRALTRDDAAATVHRLERVAARMQSTSDFTATPSTACRFCEWRDRCPDAAYVESGEYDWLADDPAGEPDLEDETT
jgi:putative RecB family exonuclease